MEPANQHQQQDPAQQQQAQVSLTRTYPVAAEKVWRAWTDPQQLSQWFGPARGQADVKAAEIDLREGGRFRFNFNMPDGDNNEASGVYQQVQPHQRLVFSWAWRSTPERVSRISITLTPVAGGTELQFVHDRFFDMQARDNHARGWAMFFDSLDSFLQPAAATTTATQET
jgi:uncharacterized protein YndB with AHSA1/START domain